jgi:aminocarboxymuconate-semialdehyde decarboxylase
VSHPIQRTSKSIPVIDFHAHTVVQEVREFSKGHVVQTSDPKNSSMSQEAIKSMETWIASNRRKMTDYRERLKDMDEMGVDIQVLTPSLVHQYTYWAEPEISLKMEQLTNNCLAESVAVNPERFIGLGSVPLQSPPHAIQELERCMGELGFKGIEISSTAEHMELGDAKMKPFWAAVERLGATVYLHPSGITDARYVRHQLWNSVGQPLEEAMAMSSLIYEGVMEAFPQLKICIAHGGGYLPFYAGRLDRNYREKPFLHTQMTKSPSDYLKENFWYDSCLYNVDMLEYLVEKVGSDRIVMGSDYPVGESDPVGFIRDSQKISDTDKDAILGLNAAKLLGLSV